MMDDLLPSEARAQAIRRGKLREPDRDYERSVLQLMQHHVELEDAILESYQELADRSSAGEAIQFLVRLVIDDEKRHHELFTEMVNEMRSILWEVPVEPSLPAVTTSSDPELLAETKRVLHFEKQDAKELRNLRKILRDSQESSLDPLMVELMLRDTEKHIAILKYIKARLAR
jgi:hypothetical protein